MEDKVDSSAGLKVKIPDFEFEAYVKESEIDKDKAKKNFQLETLGQKDGLDNIPSSESSDTDLTFPW